MDFVEEQKKSLFSNKKALTISIVTVICIIVLAIIYVPRLSNMAEMSNKGAIVNSNGSYTGNLQDGLITGVGEFKFASGDRYAGEWTNSVISGVGEYTFFEKGTYKGKFVSGHRQGDGTFLWPNGDKVQGNWIDDSLEGDATIIYAAGGQLSGYYEKGNLIRGKYTYANSTGSVEYSFDKVTNKNLVSSALKNGIKLSATINNNQLVSGTVQYPTGDSYEGSFNNGQYSGTGKYIWPDNTSYTGQWLNGEINGAGIIAIPSTGVQINGTFSNGKIVNGSYTITNSEGTFSYIVENGNYTNKIEITFSDGTAYSGTYNGKDLTGEGTFKYKNGDSYSGTVQLGLKSGTGIYTWPNSDKYDGKWSKDQMNGAGTYYFSGSSIHRLTGKFVANRPDGKCIYYLDDSSTFNTTWSKGKMTRISKR